MSTLNVLSAPAEFAALAKRDLSQTTCVVFDVLRATSSIVAALANGALAIVPVAEISDALAIRRKQPDALLAGERDGLRIGSDLTGGMEFDLGNSPREFTAERVRDRTVVMTTTNGTRALQACHGASAVFVGSFLNMNALTASIQGLHPANLLVVCSGTHDEAAYEDTLAAGALCHSLWHNFASGRVADSAQIAREIFLGAHGDLLAVMRHSRNARRLFAIPHLADDVPYCLDLDITRVVPIARADRIVCS